MNEKLTGAIIGAACTAVVVLAAVAFGFSLGERMAARSVPMQAEAPALEAAAVLPELEAGSSIIIPGFERIAMTAGKAAQEAPLYNPQENACYFVVYLFLPDGAEVYRSGLLPPGKELTSIELLRPLEAGIYEGAYIRYSCLSLEDMSPLNGADMNFTLEVE